MDGIAGDFSKGSFGIIYIDVVSGDSHAPQYLGTVALCGRPESGKCQPVVSREAVGMEHPEVLAAVECEAVDKIGKEAVEGCVYLEFAAVKAGQPPTLSANPQVSVCVLGKASHL